MIIKMDSKKIGGIIKTTREEKNFTQKQLAEILNVSDKTVSKWERGIGLPDLSIIGKLAETLGLSVETLLSGNLSLNSFLGGNMKNSRFFVCSVCGNISVCSGNAEVHCCGRKLLEIKPQKADETHDLSVETVEDEWYITSLHPMEKEHYISFVAFLTGDRIQIVKLYPEWNLESRFKRTDHGRLIFYCNKDGLFYKNI